MFSSAWLTSVENRFCSTWKLGISIVFKLCRFFRWKTNVVNSWDVCCRLIARLTNVQGTDRSASSRYVRLSATLVLLVDPVLYNIPPEKVLSRHNFMSKTNIFLLEHFTWYILSVFNFTTYKSHKYEEDTHTKKTATN